MIEAILWDLDGVLVDNAEFHYEAWRDLFRSLRRAFTIQEFQLTFGLRNDVILNRFLDPLQEEEIKALANKKERLFRKKLKGRVKPMAGALDLLHHLLRVNKKLAIVSSTPRKNVEMILRSLSLENAFQAIIAEEDVRLGKPNPEGFLMAAERLGVDSSRCAVIEDSPDGIEAAKQAGMTAIGLASTHNIGRLSRADLVVKSLGDADLVRLLSSGEAGVLGDSQTTSDV